MLGLLSPISLLPAATMRSILVIDPNHELRSFVSNILRRAGHVVRETDDMRGAATLLRSEPADLVVTDLANSTPNGAETLEALQCEFSGLEVIAISAAPHSTGYLRLAASLGAPRTIAQPFMSRELMGLINEMVAGVAAYSAHVDYQSRRMVASDRN
jgi:DNA-binding NtrC family response regulator